MPSYSESLPTLVRVGREHLSQNTRSQNIKSPEASQYHSDATSTSAADQRILGNPRSILIRLAMRSSFA
jgi:hypothetical protein